MQDPSSSPPWLVASTIVQAVSAVAVGTFAVVEFFRGRAQTNARRTLADEKASTTAFLLRRQLVSWVGPGHDDFDTWITDSRNNHSLAAHLDAAESRAIELANLAGDTSAAVGAAARMSFALFLAGTRRLTEYTSTPRPHGHGELDWIQLKLDAEKDLRSCIEALESAAIKEQLLTADREIDAIRAAENPIHQLAEVLHRIAKSRPR